MGILSYTYNAAKAAFRGKGKVSPTITSVKPNLAKTVQQTKSDNFIKNIRALDNVQKKLQTGKQMMKDAQKARKKMVDTGKAFQFKHTKSFHAMGPGDKEKYGKQMKVEGPQKKFKKGKELEQKATGGRVGLKRGTGLMSRKSNVQKIKETFAPRVSKNKKASKFGMLSVKAGIDKNPNPTQADRIAGAKMKNKKRFV